VSANRLLDYIRFVADREKDERGYGVGRVGDVLHKHDLNQAELPLPLIHIAQIPQQILEEKPIHGRGDIVGMRPDIYDRVLAVRRAVVRIEPTPSTHPHPTRQVE
jgi:hypothetical protein